MSKNQADSSTPAFRTRPNLVTRQGDVTRAAALNAGGDPVRFTMPWWVWNLFGEQAVFLLRRGGGASRR